jgi:hypothetical protein
VRIRSAERAISYGLGPSGRQTCPQFADKHELASSRRRDSNQPPACNGVQGCTFRPPIERRRRHLPNVARVRAAVTRGLRRRSPPAHLLWRTRAFRSRRIRRFFMWPCVPANERNKERRLMRRPHARPRPPDPTSSRLAGRTSFSTPRWSRSGSLQTTPSRSHSYRGERSSECARQSHLS